MNVIAYSLFGPASIYTYGAVRNAMIVGREFYQGWLPRFYYTETVPQDILSLIRYHGGQLQYVDRFHAPSPIFGRLLVMADPKVDAWMCREAEARPTQREVMMVNEWLASGKPWHVIKDHSGCAMHPVYTGCFGGRGSQALCTNIGDAMLRWAGTQANPVLWTEEKAGWFFRNQEFVRDYVWPHMLEAGVLIHWSAMAETANRQYSHYRDSACRAVPVPIDDGTGYVGEACGYDDAPVCLGLRNFQ